MFNSIKDFRDDPSLSAKLFAFCHLLYEQTPKSQKEELKENELKSERKKSETIDYLPPLVTRNKALSIYGTNQGKIFILLMYLLKQEA
jgi:hypothetical protein